MFFNIHIKGAPMFLKCDPCRVWCSIFYSKLVNCIIFIVFVKGRGTCGSEERNVKIWIDFRKSPRFSLTSPFSQEREKSSRPVFTMCGELWVHKIGKGNYINRNDLFIVTKTKTHLCVEIIIVWMGVFLISGTKISFHFNGPVNL